MKLHELKTAAAGLAAATALAVAATFAGTALAANVDIEGDLAVESGAMTITIPSATLDAAGYVAVHQGTSAALGEVIGISALTEAGTHADLEIMLDRAVADGETLWVALYTESNANTTFDGATVDLAVQDAVNGNLSLGGLVAEPVTISVEAAGSGSFSGEISDIGVSLVVFSGGSLDALLTAAAAEGATTVATTVDGEFVVHVVGAPTFVNADFAAEYAAGFTASTPVVLVKR